MNIVPQNPSGGDMAGLMPVHQEQGQLWADARTLHAVLQVGRDFSNWIKGRLDEIGATEGEEFIVLDGSPDLAKTLGRQRRDYWLHLDLAKEVAMLERTEIGRQIRRYFIEAEKQLRAQAPALPSYTEALRQLADSIERETAAQEQVRVLAPQAQQFQNLMSTQGTYSVAEAAKLLKTGEVRLFAMLRDRGVLQDRHRSGPEHHNVPYQRYLDAGYFELITRPRPDGSRITYTTRVTARGLAWLEKGLRAAITGVGA